MTKTTDPRGRTMQFRDGRAMPVSVIRHDDIARLSECFDGRRLPIARSVYFAIVQLVSEAAGLTGVATRKDLSLMAGVSVRTLDEFTAALIEHRLIYVVKRREDGINLPNVYGLGEDRGVVQQTALPPSDSTSAADSTQQSSSLNGDEGRGEGVRGSGGEREKFEEHVGLLDRLPIELRTDAQELLRRKERVGGRQVTVFEMLTAANVIHAFNFAAGSSFGLAAHLTAIVGRIRERPSWAIDVHERLIESAFRLKWWKRNGRRGGRVTPAVIYGHAGVFEQVIADAEDEKHGRSIEGPEPQRPKMVRTKTTHPWDEEF